MHNEPFRVRVLIDRPRHPNSLRQLCNISCPHCKGRWFDENLLYQSTVVLRCAVCHGFLEVNVLVNDNPNC